MAPAQERMAGDGDERRARHSWGGGSYPTFGRYLLPAIAELVGAARVGRGDRVLDVACGNGNVALTANRRGARVTGLDLAPRMLDLARENEATAGTADVAWHVGDAARLPYRAGAFDVVLSNLGLMLAANPATAAEEVTRVVAPGGRVAFTAWTPDSPLPTAYDALDPYLPERATATPQPSRWSEPDRVRGWFGDRVRDVRFEIESVAIPAASVGGFWAFLVECSGPLQATLDRIDADERTAARADVLAALAPHFDESANLVRLPYRRTAATRA